ncbi:MAG: hypothetical protein JSV35_06575 [Candidatus Bathyarchaeota archaeon]|nr:MAG: hypothetical protein JSV35_06575 [Candidatus Bathyarchaeota archaeon]
MDNETVEEPIKKSSPLPKMPDFSSLTKPEPGQEPELEMDSVKETESDQEAPEECPQFFGYLKTRPRSESFPDTCLTCRKMLECLMK